MKNLQQQPFPTPESIWAILQEVALLQKENERKFDKQMEKVREDLGGISRTHGYFAEEYFFNSFEKGNKNFFGEKFDEIEKNIRGLVPKDEYDIVLINGKAIGIIEVKFKAHENDIEKVLKKADTFRSNFPKYAKHKIYLGLASMSFYAELEQKCVQQGIAVIKQIGDAIVINDEHLKVF
jgi:hypothetical protein